MISLLRSLSLSRSLYFVTVPIKSLQSVPLAASYVSGELKISKPGMKLGKKKDNNEYNQKISKRIAKDVPGFSGEYTIDDVDDAQETRIIQQDIAAALFMLALCPH